MGQFNKLGNDVFSGLWLKKLNDDMIRVSPGSLSIRSDILTLQESVDLALTAEMKLDEREISDAYHYLYGYNGRKPDVDEATKLLIHSDDVESDPVSFVDSSESSHVITANGNVNHSVSEKKFGSSAMYFDGVGDYLTVPDSDDWNFGSGDFTIDCWVNFPNLLNYPSVVGNWSSVGGYGFDFRPHSGDIGNRMMFVYSTTGSNYTIIDSGFVLTIDIWQHIAVNRLNNDLYFFVDGILKSTHDISSDVIYNSTNLLYIGYNIGSTSEYTGYIDELRISKGIARWTENFTPDTSPYTPDINTKLLIHSNLKTDNLFLDSSESSHVITRNGDVHHNVTEKKFGQSSMYFDGTGDYLTVPDSEDFSLGLINDPFTIDVWVKTTDDQFAIFNRGAGAAAWNSTDGYHYLFYYKLGVLNFQFYNADPSASSWTTNTPKDGNWHHLCVTYDGTTTRLFIDGVNGGSSTTDTYIQPSVSSTERIGITIDGRFPFTGYMDEFRITKGLARWTENFTPDTSPYTNLENPEDGLKLKFSAVKPTKDQFNNDVLNFDESQDISLYHPDNNNLRYIGKVLNKGGNIQSAEYTPSEVDEFTKLLIHSDSFDNGDVSFVDSSDSNHIITANGNVCHDSAQNKFGNSAMYFDGDGDYLSIPDSEDWNFGTDDFTIDCWVYPNNLSSWHIIVARWFEYIVDDECWNFRTNGNNLEFLWADTSGGTPLITTSSNILQINQWQHVAVVKNGSEVVIYVNGIESASMTITNLRNSERVMLIGKSENANFHFNGYIDELRISKGIARWTENFTPPALPYW